MITDSRKNMKRKDEVFCKLRFHEFLMRLYSSESIEWEDVPPKEEPPDFFLQLSEKKFAVEVTDMVEQIDVGTARLIPRGVVISVIKDFVKKVEKEAIDNGWLSGAYVVGFRRIIKNFKMVEAELREQILFYIQSTMELESASELVFFIGDERVCIINKIHKNKDIVYPGFPAFAKWEGESTQESLDLLEERLKDKVEKLQNILSPVILLILDINLFFPNNKAFLEAVPLLPDISRFNTVFIVSPAFGDFLLYSLNSEWQ